MVGKTEELVGAFAEAVPFAIREMAGVEAIPKDTRPVGNIDRLSDLSVVVRLTTVDGEGSLILDFPQETASALTRQVLAGTDSILDEAMIRDCVGEVANVVAGQAKALLYGTRSHFTLSTPTVLPKGEAGSNTGKWIIEFNSDVGAFAAHICTPVSPEGADRAVPHAER